MGTTLFEKIWDTHVIAQDEGAPAVLYIDAHLVHEVTTLRRRSPRCESGACPCGAQTKPSPPWTTPSLHESGRWKSTGRKTPPPRYARCARIAPTSTYLSSISRATSRASFTSSARNWAFTQPGMTIVCGDSHTSTHGAFGALAFGIGTSEVGYVLATQCLMQESSKDIRH